MGILDVVKIVSQNSVEHLVCSELLIGTVATIAPITVQLEQRLVLPQAILLIPESMRETVLEHENQRFILKKGLAVGEQVLLIHLGAYYLILDRVGGFDAGIVIHAE